MKKKGMILGIIIILFAVLIIVLIPKNKNVYAVYENGQMGIITSKFKDPILVENQEKEVYHTYSDSVYLNYESYNLDNAYGNTLVINEKKEFPFKAAFGQYGVFLKNKFLFLGLNIVNGKIEIAINSGKNYGENYNTFSLRNIYLVIEEEEIWSNEYPKDEYLNQNINFGEDNMNEEVRSNYQKSVNFSFDIPDSLLDSFGVLLEDVYHQDTLDVQVEGKDYTIKNESKIDFECNIENDEIITQTKTLAITSLDNEVTISAFMDGIEIRPDLRLTENAWADGDHQLKIICRNKYNFIKTEVINFRLETSLGYGHDFNYQIYQTGVTAELPQGIDNLGVLIGDEVDSSLHEIDEDYLLTPYGPFPVINIVIEKNNQTAFNWLGYVNQGRTAFMQIYNHQQELWETVSTKLSNDDELIKLGFDYQGRLEYEKENLIYLRVVSKVNNISESKITNKIFHTTDFQYITRLLAASEIGSTNYRQALAALQSMTDYFIDQYENNDLEYLCLTGDFVQQQKGVDLSEWEVFNTNFVIPLFEAEIPFGVSSGNHDVGGVSSYYKDGANTLDQNLVYDYYYEYLGEEFFNTKDYYGEAFLNNRSHYDLMTINGHEFLFLYLGWGSSTPYIHVSSLDMDWAKTILEKYPEKTVVLATHEYMGNKGKRSVTGEMVFNNLVKEYENIKFVLSGHINGSSHRIDAIDDNGDGINDRLVLQLLTNYQEEENLFGATFIRSIGLDFDNNLIYFDHYSPYFKDYDLKLEDNYEYSKKSQAFYYAFDLSNCGYGILTDYFG